MTDISDYDDVIFFFSLSLPFLLAFTLSLPYTRAYTHLYSSMATVGSSFTHACTRTFILTVTDIFNNGDVSFSLSFFSLSLTLSLSPPYTHIHTDTTTAALKI